MSGFEYKYEQYEMAPEDEISRDAANIIDRISNFPCDVCQQCPGGVQTRSCKLSKKLKDALSSVSVQADDLDYCGG